MNKVENWLTDIEKLEKEHGVLYPRKIVLDLMNPVWEQKYGYYMINAMDYYHFPLGKPESKLTLPMRGTWVMLKNDDALELNYQNRKVKEKFKYNDYWVKDPEGEFWCWKLGGDYNDSDCLVLYFADDPDPLIYFMQDWNQDYDSDPSNQLQLDTRIGWHRWSHHISETRRVVTQRNKRQNCKDFQTYYQDYTRDLARQKLFHKMRFLACFYITHGGYTHFLHQAVNVNTDNLNRDLNVDGRDAPNWDAEKEVRQNYKFRKNKEHCCFWIRSFGIYCRMDECNSSQMLVLIRDWNRSMRKWLEVDYQHPRYYYLEPVS